MRRLAVLLPLLAACGGPPGPEAASRIECAVDGATVFTRVCTVERSPGPAARFTIRAPSGSFRRLLVTTDGRGVVAADGADPAVVTLLGDNRIEVAIAGDRYRLPATVKQ